MVNGCTDLCSGFFVDVFADSAGDDVGGHDAGAGHDFDCVHDGFPQVEEVHGKGFVLNGVAVGVVGEQVTLHPVKFVEDDAQVLCPRGDGDAADFFKCSDNCGVVHYRADAADPFCEEDGLLPGAAYHDLFDAFFDVAEFDFGCDDPFSCGFAFDAGGFFEAGVNRAYRE